ncbi:MAG: acyl-[ACP]--phospholipid O-acyltransferase [Planctomycetota bacterium]
MSTLEGNRSFWWLTASQFLGAFNDNAFKQFILVLALSIQIAWLPLDAQATAMGLFSLPFILFALLGGSLADRYSKRRIIVTMNWIEIVVMALGMIAFSLELISPTVAIASAMGVLFLMGTQSAFFGPSKYGVIPELVEEENLTRANGIINMTTHAAIILGTAAAGLLYRFLHAQGLPFYASGPFFVAIAAIGFLCSLGLRRLPAADPARAVNANIAAVPLHALRELRFLSGDRSLLLAVLASSWFNLVGACALMALNAYGREVLILKDAGSTLLMWTAGGIAVGSLLASLLSGQRVELGLVPLGAAGMAVGFWSLAAVEPDYWINGLASVAPELLGGLSMLRLEASVILSLIDPSYWIISICLVITGIFGGLYIVPLNAYIQQRPSKEEKGRVLGALELSNFVFIFLAAGVFSILASESIFALAARELMVAIGLLTLAGSVIIFSFTPHYAVRLVLWLVTHSLYRMKVMNADRVPRKGGALLVSNHVSYADPFLVGSSISRYVRFLMHRGFFKVPIIGRFGRLMRAIPISDSDTPRELLQSLQLAGDHVARGRVACIFAEGGITRTGNLLPFSKGLERIAARAGVPIVPVYIDRMWGSIFSFRKGRFLFKLPERIPYPVTVSFGKPLPATATAQEVRQAVQELGATALDARKRRGETLATRFLRVGRRHARRPAMVDLTARILGYRRLLIVALLLRRLLRKRLEGETHVGVLLPAGNGGAITNIALAIVGKISVNLNFTAGRQAFDSAVEQCGLKTVISARPFLDKIKMEPRAQILDLETLLKGASRADRVRAFLLSLLPGPLLARLPGVPREPDEDATIIFSSGSTGVPKGVRLSHHNILSNVRSLTQVFNIDRRDRVVGVLPFFHSFGYTATLWFPLLNGLMVLYHANPIDARAIADLIRAYRGTIFISTPTFYMSYLRRFTPEDFQSVRIAAAGAEKLKASLSQAWHDRFGGHILEGYGCTELSPAVSVNLPDVVRTGFRQTGRKGGTIGHPLPGVAARVVDPEAFETLAPGEEGLLLIKGPSVMRGYLHRPDLTAEVIRDGWYVTGDVARIDEDGFITITDRLSRFSKIGGEMVPHGRIEEAIQGIVDDLTTASGGEPEAATVAEVAVTSLPDSRKGERLVVLHTPISERFDTLLERLRGSDLPKLWIPRRDAFVEVEVIPKLGSGKLDLGAIREIARDRLGTV